MIRHGHNVVPECSELDCKHVVPRASRASDRHALRAAARRRDARRRPCVPVAGAACPDRRAALAAGRAGRGVSRHHRLLSDARRAPRLRHARRRCRVTDDVIIQAGSGYDISCGVLYMHVPGLTAADVADGSERRRWIREVEKRVATGVGSDRPAHMPRFSERESRTSCATAPRRSGVEPTSASGSTSPSPTTCSSSTGSSARATRSWPQLGSVGGGNHFIEMQVDRDDGAVWVMIHCGSRGYGWQTANHFFYEGARAARPAEEPPRGLVAGASTSRSGASTGPTTTRRANYAVANRHIIVARRPASARRGLRRERRGVLRDLAQPRAGRDARPARRPHAARLRAPQGRDARVSRGPSRPRRYRLGRHRSPVPHPGLDVRRRGDPVPARGRATAQRAR